MKLENNFIKVGEALETKDIDSLAGSVTPKVVTVVKIIDLESADEKEIVQGTTPNQRALRGDNLVDDPKLIGRIDPSKIYVLEE